MKNIAIIASILVLAGCAPFPMHGTIGNKEFAGTYQRHPAKPSEMIFTTEDGVHCTGVMRTAESKVSGEGDFECEDGTKGTMRATMIGKGAKGFGKTSTGKKIKFTIGNPGILIQQQ